MKKSIKKEVTDNEEKTLTYAKVAEFYLNAPERVIDKISEFDSNSYERVITDLANTCAKRFGQSNGGYIDVANVFYYFENSVLDLSKFDFKVNGNVMFAWLCFGICNKPEVFLNKFENNDEKDLSIRIAKYLVDNYKNMAIDRNQKWHILQYILFQILSNKYGKFDPQVSDKNSFNSEFQLYGKTKCCELLIWMAETAGIENDKIAEMYSKVEHGQSYVELRNVVSWDEIRKKFLESRMI